MQVANSRSQIRPQCGKGWARDETKGFYSKRLACSKRIPSAGWGWRFEMTQGGEGGCKEGGGEER